MVGFILFLITKILSVDVDDIEIFVCVITKEIYV